MAYIVLIASLFLTSCFFDTADSVSFGVGAPPTNEQTVQPLFDADDVPTGMVCEHQYYGGAVCDPVLQDCGAEKYCVLAVDTEVERARAVCKPMPEEEMTGVAGDDCTDQPCAIGFLCVSGMCCRFCELETGFGCEEDEFCDDKFPGTHGVCTSACR